MIRPLSFLVGKDQPVLRQLLELHARAEPQLLSILDVTYGKGVLWKGTGLQPYRCDLDPAKGLDEVQDFRDLSWSPANWWDVVVFDPPHMTDVGKNSQMLDRYGTGKGDNISAWFPPFLSQVGRILKPDGIVLAKIADQVHSTRHQWQLVDFVNAVRAAGLVACDLVVKADPSAGKMTGLWKRVLHVRNAHCYWVVVRKGTRCSRK